MSDSARPVSPALPVSKALYVGPEHQRQPGEPEHRAHRDARPDGLCQEKRPERDVHDDDGRKRHRDQTARQVEGREIEDDVVDREQEHALERHEQVRPRREAQGQPARDTPAEDERRGEGEPVNNRRLRRDHAELEGDGEPRRAPDGHGREIEQDIVHRPRGRKHAGGRSAIAGKRRAGLPSAHRSRHSADIETRVVDVAQANSRCISASRSAKSLCISSRYSQGVWKADCAAARTNS